MIDWQCPLLSVIVPVYNVEPYLERCMESILSQTYKNLEVICVNDGSTDGSLNILQKYQTKDQRVKIVSKENGGLVSARKAGINIASGDYATYVDSDDFIEQKMYEILMKLIVESQVDMVTSGCYRDYGVHVITESEEIKKGKYSDSGLKYLISNMIDTSCFFRYNLSCHLYNKIFRTPLIKKFQNDVPDSISIGEDAAVFYPLILSANSVYVSGYDFYHYCIRPDSVMGAASLRDKDPVYLMLSYLSEIFNSVEDESKNLKGQFYMFSLYTRLLRNPYEILEYKNGFLFPFGEIDKDDRILLCGAGKFGVSLKCFLDENGFDKIIWVDQNSKAKGTVSWDEIQGEQIDKIVVGTLIYATTENLLDSIKKRGYSDDMVLSISRGISSLRDKVN